MNRAGLDERFDNRAGAAPVLAFALADYRMESVTDGFEICNFFFGQMQFVERNLMGLA
jgi:hypothetical protein